MKTIASVDGEACALNQPSRHAGRDDTHEDVAKDTEMAHGVAVK